VLVKTEALIQFRFQGRFNSDLGQHLLELVQILL
jgi:hypothetical protein